MLKQTLTISMAAFALTTFVACGKSSDHHDDAPAAAPTATTTSTNSDNANAGSSTGADATGAVTGTPATDPAATGATTAPVVHDVVKQEVDATNTAAFVYLDLDTGKMVPETDASWDLAFKRTVIKMNTDVKAAYILKGDFDALSKAPEDAHFLADAPVAGGKETDGLVFHGEGVWYWYDINIHVIYSNNNVYLIKTNGGKTIKLAIDDYYNVDRLPAYDQLRYQIIAE